MVRVYTYKRKLCATSENFDKLIHAHHNISYVYGLNSEDIIIIIADWVCYDDIPSKIYTVSIKKDQLLKIAAENIKDDNYAFFDGDEKIPRQMECIPSLFPDEVFNSNVMEYWGKRINIYGSFAKYVYYYFLNDKKSNDILDRIICTCFYTKDIEKMLRYFRPESQHILIIRGIKRESVTAEFIEFISNVARGEFTLRSVKYEYWHRSIILLSDYELLIDGFIKEKNEVSEDMDEIHEELMWVNSALEGTNYEAVNAGIKNPMLAEMIKIFEIGY